MIKVQNLTKRFGSILAVDDIAFEVKQGEVLGFLGPNGAGKSTTMKMLTCFLQPTMGTAEIDVAILDIDLQGLSSTPIARNLGERGLPFLFLTGYESVALLPDDLHEVRCLTKPVDPDVLARALLEQMRDHEQGS